jgi:hypothetical protein
MINRATLAGCALCCVAAGWPCLSQAPLSTQSLVQQTQSQDWKQRASAFATLQGKQRVWNSPGMADVLMRLLEREDLFMASPLREASGASGEDYAEYRAAVIDACIRDCDKEALLALWLAEARRGSVLRHDVIDLLGITHNNHGFSVRQQARMDSTLLSAAADPGSSFIREGALAALGYTIRGDAQLTAERRARIHAAVVAAASDKYDNVRASAVRRLAEFADPKDRPLLTQLAKQDTAHSVNNRGQTTFPVREEAKRALAKLPPR